MTMWGEPIEIRTAIAADAADLRRLAERDCAPAPGIGALLAIRAGEIVAAREPGGRIVADPFAPTAGLAAMLEVHAVASNRAPGRSPATPRLRFAR